MASGGDSNSEIGPGRASSPTPLDRLAGAMGHGETGTKAKTQVLISGAGPTGLLLAVELRRRGVDCLLIDELGGPRGWDRATVIHPRSLEILEALGLVSQFLELGARMRVAQFHSDGELLGELDLELTSSRYGFDLQLSEEMTERMLTAYLESVGGSVTRSTRLVGFVQRADGVTATLERDGARFEVEAEWLVGCDGLHSVVREQSGIEFPGVEIEGQWAVFDAGIAGWDRGFDIGSVFLDPPPLILMPMPRQRWRAYMRPTSDESDLVAEATEELRRYLPGAEFTEVENPARFHCHSRVASSYRSGRVLLAGDAAHVCSPAEGHGMNTGLQDSFNLGWKLALVCHGLAGEGLIDTHETERRPVAARIVASGTETETSQALTDAGERAERDATVRRVFGDPETSHHESVASAELDRSYAESPIVAGSSSAEGLAGRLLPDTAPVDYPGQGSAPLHRFAHRAGHTVIVLGGPDADPAAVAGLAARLEAAHADSPVVDAILGFSVRPGADEAGRIDNEVAELLGVDGVTVLVIRPDRYVGLRHDGADAEPVARYLDALTGLRAERT
jgi:2-polyprenyl-6-methoxyphenol hydroxylase-like FAD-dependent oxidoreductase